MAPQYGKWATETSVSDLLTGTLGAAPFVDEEEKTRIAALSKLLQDPKKSRCEDFSDLCTITLPEWDLHIRQAGWPLDEVHAVRRQLFKYMGERGAPHVPPSAAAIPGAPYRPLCCAHTWSPTSTHPYVLNCILDSGASCACLQDRLLGRCQAGRQAALAFLPQEHQAQARPSTLARIPETTPLTFPWQSERLGSRHSKQSTCQKTSSSASLLL